MQQFIEQPFLETRRDRVQAAWIDYNGHMSEAYYVLVFGFATDALLDHIGVDQMYREAQRSSVYTLEAHIAYLREVGEGVALRVYTQLLQTDSKRMHVYHHMLRDDSNDVIATTELMLMYVDMQSGRAAAFPPAIADNIARLRDSQQALARPQNAGARIALRG